MPTNFVPVIPESAPFTPAQRGWLNGFLAGIFSGTPDAVAAAAAPAAASAPKRKIPILFGSETGNCEALARRLAKSLQQMGFDAQPTALDQMTGKSLAEEQYALILTSTFGDGEPPENARVLHRELHRPEQPRLDHLHYAVLALGDRNYEQFCKCGVDFDRRLTELGAKRIYERVDCDVDYEEEFERWRAGVAAALEAVVSDDTAPGPGSARVPRAGAGVPPARTLEPSLIENGVAAEDRDLSRGGPHIGGTVTLEPSAGESSFRRDAETSTRDARAPRIAELAFSRKNPFPARLLANRPLTGDGSAKETRHFELSLEGLNEDYEPGDALGVVPTNCPGLVNELLQVLGRDGEEAVPTPQHGEVPLRTALLRHYEITKVPPALLKAIAARSADRTLLDLMVPEAKGALTQYLWGREILDVLMDFSSVTFTPVEFVGQLRALQPRLYSISSSLKAHPEQVHLTVAAVRYETLGRGRKGVCSTFLADRAQGSIPVFVQRSHSFRLPSSGDVPIIMVGPGTGIAPFRAFLWERRATGAKGRNWLFFGEQHAATGFFYRDEIEAMRADGHLTKLSTAFSRDQSDKIYVQHRLLEHARDVWRWLQEGAHFYVCGDASRMAKDVDAALHAVLERAGGLSREAGVAYVQQLKTNGRYQRDVY